MLEVKRMRIAVSGTHFMGKSTLIEDFIKRHPDYKTEVESYYKLHDELEMELSLEPTLESLVEQLDCSIAQLNEHTHDGAIIFDRCPVDYIAYALCIAAQDSIDIHDTEIAERFSEVKAALNHLDLIVFLPMTKEHHIEYTEENPAYRKLADKFFKRLYRDDICDIFPHYGHPKIIEIWGDRKSRILKLESYV
jgi:hypothetical protein